MASPPSQPTPSGADLLARLDRIPVWPYPRSVLVIVGAGFFFAYFDIVTIGFALPVISEQFHVSAEAASWSITSGLIGYILGSFLDSRIGDRYGRRVSLFLSVAAFSVGSLLSATSPSLDWLVFWRFVSGMGIGAEIALVTTYMAEVSPAPLRGRYTGWTIVAAFAGFAVVPVLALMIVPSYAWGWRALFVVGALGGLLIGFMRRNLPDSIHWLVGAGRYAEAEATLAAAESLAEERMGGPLGPAPPPSPAGENSDERGDLGAFLKPPLLGRLALLASIWFIYYVGNYGWLTLAPELFSKHGFSLEQSIGSLAITGLGFVGGALAAVFTSDRIDRRRAAAALALVWAFTLAGIGFYASTWTIPILGLVASFSIGFFIPVLYTITGENFPTRVRATGVSLSDGVGHLGGAFCGQIVLGVDALYGFQGAFLAMAATGLAAAVLVGFVRNQTGSALD
ncbi:MAG: MFS transporter [Myxococcota bacterium]|nr:MFS transporter [Myxococcota bacterium]